MVFCWCLGEILLVIFSREYVSKCNVHLTRVFLLQKIMDDLDVDPKDEKVTYSEFRAGMKSHWHLFKPKINKYVLSHDNFRVHSHLRFIRCEPLHELFIVLN